MPEIKPRAFERVLLAMFLLTVLAIVSEPWLLGKSFVIKPDSNFGYGISSDRDLGGNSDVIWVNQEKKEWLCKLRDIAAYPYCNFQIYLDHESGKGANLTHYDKINIWLSYRGPANTIRLFIRNSNPAYTRLDDNSTTKFHQLEVDPELFAVPVEIDLTAFVVADWWLKDKNIPLKYSQREMDNVTIIDISTGTEVAPGEHYFKFHHIILTGSIITTEKWYLLIVCAWLVVIFAYLVSCYIGRQVEKHEQLKREAEFREITTLLNNREKELQNRVDVEARISEIARRDIEQALRSALSDWKSQQLPFSIILLDLDFFKSINDQLGDNTGDKVLIGVSVLINSNIRVNEYFNKWGSDEFVIVCHGASDDTTKLIAEKLRRLIEVCEFGVGRHITASFGVASLLPGESLSDLFKRADVALYAAKAVGRNRVCLSGEDGPSRIE